MKSQMQSAKTRFLSASTPWALWELCGITNCLPNSGLRRGWCALLLIAIGMVVFSPMANASILPLGPCPNTPPAGSGPVCDATGQPTGTLLASLSAPFTSTLGTTSGTLISAVYREAGGTLDFYYQVINNTTSTNCGTPGKPACDAISRETDTNFATWLTQLAFRTDGSVVFTAGDTRPQFADRNSPNGNVIGFEFNPLDSQKIFPGHSSNVLIISTNATNFAAGNASVIDGGTMTVASFEPLGSATPEPSSLLLFGTGLLSLGCAIRRKLRS